MGWHSINEELYELLAQGAISESGLFLKDQLKKEEVLYAFEKENLSQNEENEEETRKETKFRIIK